MPGAVDATKKSGRLEMVSEFFAEAHSAVRYVVNEARNSVFIESVGAPPVAHWFKQDALDPPDRRDALP